MLSKFRHSRESGNPGAARVRPVAPCSCQGQALGPRFRGGDDTLLRLAATSRVRFSGGRTVDFELPCHDAPSGNFGVKKLSKPPCRGVLEASWCISKGLIEWLF